MSALKTKALLQAAIMPVLLWGLLVVTAGTLRYREAWVYCGITLIASLLITNHLATNDPALLERRMKIGRTAEPDRTQRIIVTLLILTFLATFAAIGLEYRRFGSVLPVTVVLVADLVVVVSLWFTYRVFRANTYASSLIEVDEAQRVVDTGPYRLVRHPMYAAALLSSIATPIALGTRWSVLSALPLTLLVVLRLLNEERYLAAHLPGYAAYCQKTRYRLIPGIW